MMENKITRNIFFALFAISGFSGLIYESIWSHYLKLFLGHAAYAQTLVLAIFMGGMAIGSWISSIYSPRIKHLLLSYAVIEGGIGLFAIGFHSAFLGVTEFAYDTILPNLGSAGFITVTKWGLASLLILPQSILLGMTFPLMSAGILRVSSGPPGFTLSMLYFTNSLGATAGILISGFVLIEMVGLPGTILTAGIINVALAIIVWLLVRWKNSSPQITKEVTQKPESKRTVWYRLLLLTALITGLSSFIYEISWIRMLSLVLGSSTHAFEIMLSAFLLGLALGGYWIRRRIDAIRNPLVFLATVQVVMGICALLSLPLYNETFHAMKWLMAALDKNINGYALFNISSHFLSLAVMLPATFCAGMTLPLITHVLIRQGVGEKSIGAVYSTNTIGAIIGIVFAIHIGLPLLGLRDLMVLGAGMDIALGVAIIWITSYNTNTLYKFASTLSAIGIISIAVGFGMVTFNPLHLASGVYRTGSLIERTDANILFHQDGKTATVSVVRIGDSVSIRTNGKPDAAISLSNTANPLGDEATGILAGALPVIYHPSATKAAVIGIGSGLSSHALLTTQRLKHVDTIEIEPAMLEGARKFGVRNERVYSDQRSKIYIDDAKSFFSTQQTKYDIIVSEPSNPWVSGIAGLFSEEFYHHVNRHLKNDGLFVQWLQIYEINLDLVASVIKALNTSFDDYVIYAVNDVDLIILAKPQGKIPNPDYEVIQERGLSEELRHIGIETAQDLDLRKLGNKKVLDILFQFRTTPANSDYFPILDINSARTRFTLSSAKELIELSNTPLPLLEMLGVPALSRKKTAISKPIHLSKVISAWQATALRDYLLSGVTSKEFNTLPSELKYEAEQVRVMFSGECRIFSDITEWRSGLHKISGAIIPHLTPGELAEIWNKLDTSGCRSLLEPKRALWLELYRAISARHAGRMTRISQELLKTDQEAPSEYRAYLLASGMLANISQGKHYDARRMWYQYSKLILETESANPLMAAMNVFMFDLSLL